MAFSKTVGTGLTVTGSGDPNGFSTVAPYTLSDTRGSMPFKVSSAWATQAKKSILPVSARDQGGARNIRVFIKPSSPATVAITFHQYSTASGTWGVLTSFPSATVSTSGTIFTISDCGEDAIFPQITTLSAGTLSLYVDSSNADVG